MARQQEDTDDRCLYKTVQQYCVDRLPQGATGSKMNSESCGHNSCS